MDNDRLRPFLFEGEIIVRVIVRSGQPWFVASDVCRALGLLSSDDTVESLDDDERGKDDICVPDGSKEVTVVSESGMFSLIFKSRKPEALRFRKWVTSEVLPALRGVDIYLTSEVPQPKKPYVEWSQDERRTAMALVRLATETWNAGPWMWEYIGLPMPPLHLLPAWRQADLFSDHAGQPNA